MAKAKKGGLGRGLNSLLGGEPESSLPQEKASPVERIEVEAEPKPKKEINKTPGQEPKMEKEAPAPKAEPEPVEEDVSEDNVTIKGVVSRPADPDTVNAPKRIKADRIKGEPRVEEHDSDEVDIDLVQPNPHQPRTSFKKEDLEELAESIKRNGLLQPILVRKMDDGYQIIAGERRWQACKKLGMKKVPIRVRDVDDDETIALALIENIQRSDLNPIEEAYGYRRMMDRGKMTQTQVAQAVSKGRSTIANALRLLELPEEAQQLLFEEKITAGHARAILSVPSPEGRARLTEKLVTEQLSVRETEAIARLMSGKKDSKPAVRPKTPKSYKTVARALRSTLDTDVRVKSVKGKNKIEIEFKDEADLERLFRIITAPESE